MPTNTNLFTCQPLQVDLLVSISRSLKLVQRLHRAFTPQFYEAGCFQDEAQRYRFTFLTIIEELESARSALEAFKTFPHVSLLTRCPLDNRRVAA